MPTPCRTTNVKLSEIIFLIEKLQQLRTCLRTCLVSDLTQFHMWTLQRASWLLPIVDSGIDESEEVRKNFFNTFYVLWKMNFEVDYFDGMCCANLRNVIWRLFEERGPAMSGQLSVITGDVLETLLDTFLIRHFSRLY